jgi:hypothetical protein
VEFNRYLHPPSEYYSTTEEWLNTQKDPGRSLQLFYNTHRVYLREPKGLENPVHWIYRPFNSKKYRQQNGYALQIPYGRVCREKCTIITPEHKELWDLSWLNFKGANEKDLHLVPKLPSIQNISGTVALLGIRESGVYYHWMVDLLPRLHLLHKLAIPIDRYIFNGGSRTSFQIETLKMLNFPVNKIIWSNNDMHIRADMLIVPGGGYGILPLWAIQYLREELMVKHNIQPISGYERIYISRAEAAKRRVLNENEVMLLLEKYGFRSVTLETMPVSEQIQLFASARAIIAPHGGGLTNIMFSQPGTKVIEIFSPNHMHTCYPIISSHLKHDHYYLVGKGKRPPEYVNPRIHADHITVSLRDLHHIIKMAGL